MNAKTFILIVLMAQTSGAVYYCSVSDPCGQANSTSFYEPYARFENCQHDNKNSFCDRYITPQWYRVDDVMLTQCPSLLSCGALYPVWLNGSLPSLTDGIVNRKACKVGFESCCTRSYDIQIKHCGSFYAYCLAALDTCPERYCFGKQGTCEIPTSLASSITTTTTQQTTPSLSMTCLNDPCIESNVRSLDHQESRSLHCGYKKSDENCDNDMTSGWYKSESTMVTQCPGLLACGSIYPVWLNGTIPSTGEGIVTRQACQRGFSDCCSTSYDIKVRNCGRYTAYCLRALSTCPARYCFGTGQCNSEESKDSDKNDEKEHSHGKLSVLLGGILGVLILILIVLILINFKRHNKRRGKTGSVVNIQMTEKLEQGTSNPLYRERGLSPPPYSP
ncbi:uncharacterized protein LOC111099976 [Crassostrea virginica]